MTVWPARVAVVLVSLVVSACERPDAQSGSREPMQRVNAVPATARKSVSLAELCDDGGGGKKGATFQFPSLVGAAPASAGRWRWINVWATWCKPCIEELPLLARLDKRLDRDQIPLDLVYLSVDESDQAIESFRAKHPWTPVSLRAQDVQGLEPWIVSLGLDARAAIPIHVFVDPDQAIRCARSGPISDKHYRAIAALVAQVVR